jgi:hypothetical protein
MTRLLFSLLFSFLLAGCGNSGNSGDLGVKDSSFTSNQGQVESLDLNSNNEAGSGSVTLASKANNKSVSNLSVSSKAYGNTDSPQLVVYGRQLNTTIVASQVGQLANNKVVGAVSGSGYSVAGVSLSGRVYHWRSHELIADVRLELSEKIDGVSSELDSTTTDAVGEFTLASNVAGEKMITAAKEMTANDQQKVVTSADALAALKIAVGLNPNGDDSFPVSPYQMIAADVNKDGRVNSADALKILKIAVGLSDAIPQEWLFVSETEDFWDETANNGEGEFALTNKDVSWGSEGLQFSEQLGLNSNFLGVLLGDVNGSWSAPEEAMELPDNYFASLEQAGIGPVYQWFSVIAA